MKLRRLADLARELEVDLVICTGDYAALGTDGELAAAREAVEGLTKARLGFVTVPGNHDIYLADSLREGWFEKHFREFLSTDMPDHCGDDGWPHVRLVGEDLAIVAVNSARPNPEILCSNGHVPEAQLEGLGRILEDARMQGRFVFVITHYAPRLADGTPDTPAHGLTNADALLDHCRPIARGALLHGHVHRCFHVNSESIPLFGAGSATHRGREGFWVFDVDAKGVTATPGTWQESGYVLDAQRAVSF